MENDLNKRQRQIHVQGVNCNLQHSP
jgi:hypothetical protein